MGESIVSDVLHTEEQNSRMRNLIIGLFVIFALSMGFYGVTAIEAAHTNFAAVYDPSILENRVAAQQKGLAGRSENLEEEYVGSTGLMLPVVSKLSNAQEAFYGHDGLFDTLIYYAEMPTSHIATLSFHNFMGGMCMLFGALQFWPAFRKRYPIWHRSFGAVYMVAAQLGMVAAMAYMVMTPLEKMYDTLTFTVGLWFLAIGVTSTLWMSIWHLRRKEYAQHQAYMALNYGFLLTAPFTRINWTWAAGFYPELTQYTSNYLATAVLIPGCILIGYALLCMNRWLQKERTTPNPKSGVSPALQSQLQRLFSSVAIALAAFGIVTLVWFGLLNPGLDQSALAVQLLPASVIAHDSLVLGEGLTFSKIFYAFSAIGALVCGIQLLRLVFGHAVQANARPVRLWTIGLVVLALLSGVIMTAWGWQYGGPSKATLAGGAPFVLNGLSTAVFALLLAHALYKNDSGLIKERGLFAVLCVLAFPAFYWALGIINLFPIADAYIAEGHVYRLAMYSGLFLLVGGVVYSAYGEATLQRFAR